MNEISLEQPVADSKEMENLMMRRDHARRHVVQYENFCADGN